MQRKRQSFFLFALLRRSLPYQKVVQAEDNAKEKTKFFPICIAETKPTLSKGSASRGKYKINHIYFYCRGDAYPNNHGMAPVGSALLAMPSPPKVKWPCIPPRRPQKMKRPTFTFLMTAPSSLKMAPGNIKVGRHRWGNNLHCPEMAPHSQRFLLFYFYTFLLFNQRVPIGWYIPVNKPGNTGGVLGGMVTKTHGMDAARANPHFLGLGLSGIELVEHGKGHVGVAVAMDEEHRTMATGYLAPNDQPYLARHRALLV